LAENYFEQGEYAKAESIYKKLYKGNRSRSIHLLFEYVKTLQAQEKYQGAEELLKNRIDDIKVYPTLNIELGYNYQIAGDQEAADREYDKALKLLEKNPKYAYSAGSSFQKHNLLTYAASALEIALDFKSSPSYTVRLAQIYGEQGRLKEMFGTFLDLVEKQPRYFYSVNRNFSKYIKKDPQTEANQILRKLLLKRLRKNPKVFYNEMLSWLFTKEQRYQLAFTQEKAIYRRSNENNMNGLMDLARVASNHGDNETAQKTLDFIIDEAANERVQLRAQGLKMQITVQQSKPKNFEDVTQDFEDILKKYGTGRNTLGIQLAYAQFLAFRQNAPDQAKKLLNELLNQRIRPREEAQVKMKLGDILVLERQFNQALIYYSQIQNLLKNSGLAQQAGFKVAKTSYYKGDFEWAQTQLKILKQATSQRIANDAMELSLLISDNIKEDSTHAALKLFAEADLFEFQEKNEAALSVLDSVLINYKGDKIEDEALLRKGKILEKKEKFAEAAEAYQKIIDYFGEDILADNAYYLLGKLYQTELNQPEKAKEYFREIVFNFSDSIFYVDARKRFRELRGDAVK
jgi:tetratricopeptide (TPR) repeat protein